LGENGVLIRFAAWLAVVYRMMRAAFTTLQDDVLVEAGKVRFSRWYLSSVTRVHRAA
jgi:hypothetical protein